MNVINIPRKEQFDNLPNKNQFDLMNDRLGIIANTLERGSIFDQLDDFIQSGEIAPEQAAGIKNSLYRGKNLGSAYSSEQKSQVASNKFGDLWTGDYWTINGVEYPVAHFNYYLNSGDTALTKPHLTLTTAQDLYAHHMNPTNTTEGGYMGSVMYETGLDQARSTIQSAFGASNVLTHRKYLSNAIDDGKASAGAWADVDVDLMNEMMAYGGIVNGRATYSGIDVLGYYNVGIEKSQLALFKLRPDLLNIRITWWLKDVVSAADFARVDSSGNAIFSDASVARRVRPVFSVS